MTNLFQHLVSIGVIKFDAQAVSVGLPGVNATVEKLLDDAVREAGLDLAKAENDEEFRSIVVDWVSGRIDRDEFVVACRALAGVRPALASTFTR